MFKYETSFRQFSFATLQLVTEKINSLNKNSITELGCHSGYLTLELSKTFPLSNIIPVSLSDYKTTAHIRKVLDKNNLSMIKSVLLDRKSINDYIKAINTDIIFIDNSFFYPPRVLDEIVNSNIICDVIYVDGESIIHVNTESLISQKRKDSMVIQPEPQPEPEPVIEEPVVNTEEAVPEYAAVEEVKEEVVVEEKEEEKVKPKRKRRSRSKKTNSE